MLTIMDLLKKDSANKLNKLVESKGQPLGIVVAELLENQLSNFKDGTQSHPKVVETTSNNPKNTNAPEVDEEGIFTTWQNYPKRAAKAFTKNNIKTPEELVSYYTFKMISELHGVGESTAQKVFDKLKEDGYVKSVNAMGKNAPPANVATYHTEGATTKPAKISAPTNAQTAKNMPRFEGKPTTHAQDDADAVATDWYGKILDLSPNTAKASLAAARSMFASAWNISHEEAMGIFKELGIVKSFAEDQSPENITKILKRICNALPASYDLTQKITDTANEINAFGGSCDIDAIVGDFDKNSLTTLTVGEANKVLDELRHDLQSYRDAKAHEDSFGDDDEFEDDEDDDMPF